MTFHEKRIAAATLFSGIGAPEEAMPHWHWAWCAEIDNFPSAVMAARHPSCVNLGDVCADDFTERAAAIARPDVLVFGSPCQSFSVAGRRLGLDDARGNLALVALGIVARLKPRWFVFENVPGLMSSAEGRDFGLFLRAVDELGYAASWTVLDAQFFGVAQRRERLFVVGYSGDWRYPAAVLFEPESLRGYHPPRREKGQRIAPTIESRADAGGASWGTDFLAGGGLAVGIGGGDELGHALTGKQQKRWEPSQETHVIAGTLQCSGKAAGTATQHDVESGLLVFGGNNTQGAIDVATACRAKGGTGHGDFESETFVVAGTMGQRSVDHPSGLKSEADFLVVADPISANEAKTYTHEGRNNFRLRNVVAFDTTQITSPGNYSHPKPGDACHPLARGQHVPAVAVALRGREGGATGALRQLWEDGPDGRSPQGRQLAQQLARELGKTLPQLSHVQPPQVSAVRRLTPVECEKLQGFPPNYTLVAYRGQPAKDGPRYRALGNSMAVPVVRWILERIELMETKVLAEPVMEAAE